MWNRGQINLGLAGGMAIVSFVAAPIIGFFTAQASTYTKISELDARSQVQEIRVTSIEKRQDRFESKLDALLYVNGLDPTKIKQ